MFLLKNQYLSNINILGISKLNPFQGLTGPMLFYFALGGYLHNYRENLQQISYIKLIVVLFLGWFLLFCEWYIISSYNSSNWDSIFGGYSTVATILMSCAVFIIIFKLSNKISSKNWIIKIITYIGKNTLSIYYVHWIIGYSCLSFIQRTFFNNKTGILVNYFKAILMVIIIATISEWLKKLKNVNTISEI